MARMIVPGAPPEGLDGDDLAAWRAMSALIIPDLAVVGVCPGDAIEVHADLVDQLEAQGWAKAPAAARTKKKSDPDASVEPEEATE